MVSGSIFFAAGAASVGKKLLRFITSKVNFALEDVLKRARTLLLCSTFL